MTIHEQMQLIFFNLNLISKFNNSFLYQIPNLHLLNKSLTEQNRTEHEMIVLLSHEIYNGHGPLTPCSDRIAFPVTARNIQNVGRTIQGRNFRSL